MQSTYSPRWFPKGTLHIPAGSTIRVAEPSINIKIAANSELRTRPAEYTPEERTEMQDSNPPIFVTTDTEQKAIGRPLEYEYKYGQPRPNSNPKIWCVNTFEEIQKNTDSKRKDESNKEYKYDSTKFIDSNKIKPIETFTTFKEDIFRNPPSLNDIVQGSIGNCFFLASLNAILSTPNGANYIQSMMKQEGDYTIVKLFHPKTLEPVYIEVKNSELTKGGLLLANRQPEHKAKWVHILEKAYTVLGYQEKDPSLTSMQQSEDKHVYTKPAIQTILQGGNPGFALTILTGNLPRKLLKLTYEKKQIQETHALYFESNIRDLITTIRRNYKEKLLESKNAETETSTNAEAKRNSAQPNAAEEILDAGIKKIVKAILESAQNRVYFYIFDENENSLSEWIKLLINNNLLLLYLDTALEDANPIDAFIKVLEQQVEAKFLNKFQEKLTGPNFLPMANGPVGSGQYDWQVIGLINNMKYELDQGTPIVVGTHKDVSRNESKGLLSNHAYSVENIYQDTNGCWMFTLRNPWRSDGRKYIEGTYQPQAVKNDPIVTIEARDFLTYFSTCSYGENTRPIQRNNAFLVEPKKPTYQDYAIKIIAGALLTIAIGAILFSTWGLGGLPVLFLGIGKACLGSSINSVFYPFAYTIGALVYTVAASTVGAVISYAFQSIIKKFNHYFSNKTASSPPTFLPINTKSRNGSRNTSTKRFLSATASDTPSVAKQPSSGSRSQSTIAASPPIESKETPAVKLTKHEKLDEMNRNQRIGR